MKSKLKLAILICACFLTVSFISSSLAQNILHGGDKKEVLTNAEVIELTKLGLSDATIIEKIRLSEHRFDTSVEALRQLKGARVSDSVIREMINPEASAQTISPAQVEGKQSSGAGTPVDQQFLGRYIGAAENSTEHAHGRMSIDIEEGDGNRYKLKLKAWDGLVGEGTFDAVKISTAGQLSATGIISEPPMVFRGSRAWDCNITGFIRGNKLTGNYSLFPKTVGRKGCVSMVGYPCVGTAESNGRFSLDKFRPLVLPQ
jgi:hypothetical protein